MNHWSEFSDLCTGVTSKDYLRNPRSLLHEIKAADIVQWHSFAEAVFFGPAAARSQLDMLIR
jgi:hypothetical protein